MSTYIDEKYINLVSRKLDKFSWKTKTLACARCPICGDSRRDKSKKRFYFFVEKGCYFVKCHNCGYTTTFSKFLEEMDSNLYREYVFERFANNNDKKSNAKLLEEKILNDFSTDTSRLKNSCLVGLKSIEDLDDTHYAKQYIVSRKIPEKYHSILFFTENFKEVASSLDEEKHVREEPRLIIPFYDTTGRVFAVQGRSFDKTDALRYITIKDKTYSGPKIYGLERYEPSMKGYIVEGPLDSLFIPNTIASAGSDLATITNKEINTENMVFVFDNEPRNPELCKQILKCINKGNKICIWPSSITKKDINDMVLVGLNPHTIIDSNTYNGLEALIRFNEWKKV
jgi:Zn ribbon nucleic-acid-binding protein